MRFRIGILATFLALGCTDIRDVPGGSELGALRGRCIEIVSPLSIVSTRAGEVTDSYVTDDVSRATARLEPGDTVIVDRIVLRSTFESENLVIVGHKSGLDVPRKTSLFELFDPQWLLGAQSRAFGRAAEPERGTSREVVLRNDVAKWCSEPRH